MSIANIVLSASQMWKSSGKVQFSGNCKFPEVFIFFFIFYHLIIIFAIDIYTFLESGHQCTAKETLKGQKAGIFLTLWGQMQFFNGNFGKQKRFNSKSGQNKIV